MRNQEKQNHVKYKKMLGIGATIRRERIKKGLTQEELSEKASISNRFLQKIESEANTPSFQTFFKLVKALETSPDKMIVIAWKEWLKAQK